MSKLKHAIFLLILCSQLVSCSIPSLSEYLPAPVAAIAENPGTLQPYLLTVPADATATPTPFQPLPPTPILTPTAITTLVPLPTSTSPVQVVLATPALPVENIPEAPKVMTILLLGSDKRPWEGGFRTDTIVLLTLNTENGTASLLSFPRDLYVNIPGWTTDRINTAFYHGGFKLLVATLQQNFGVSPSHYVLINFRSFKQIVDSLGSLQVNVGTTVTDRYPGKGWVTIKKGTVKMNADLALWYARSRKTSNDFARNRRQQEVLMALFDKFISMDAIKRVPEFYKLYKKSVSTDLTLLDGLSLIPLALQLIDTSRIKHYYINPTDVWNYITPGGAMVLLPREDQIRKTVKQALTGK
jgi:LCP family protein required for cell wall assembly